MQTDITLISPLFLKLFRANIVPLKASVTKPKRTVKATKAAARVTRAPEEADLTSERPPTSPGHPGDLRAFTLHITVFADSTKLYSDILHVPFRSFKFHEFVAEHTRKASEY